MAYIRVLQKPMPPDTTHIPGQTAPPLFKSEINKDSLINALLDEKYREEKSEQKTDWFGALSFPLFIMIMVIALKWNKIGSFLGWKDNRKRKRVLSEMDENGLIYDSLLTQYNSYYKSLPFEEKERFLERTILFRKSKEFRFYSMPEDEHIPILISGAAIQLTFGLGNYLMDYFEVIHVIRNEYVMNVSQRTLYGHVNHNGIHVSWTHFMHGYNDYTDSRNVGLHEMAHALHFDAFFGIEDNHDRSFKERLTDFSKEGMPVLEAMQTGMSFILHNYASINFEEFWAVSVETFFENPGSFKEKLPRLYEEMCSLLNQDPMLPQKVIKNEILH